MKIYVVNIWGNKPKKFFNDLSYSSLLIFIFISTISNPITFSFSNNVLNNFLAGYKSNPLFTIVPVYDIYLGLIESTSKEICTGSPLINFDI